MKLLFTILLLFICLVCRSQTTISNPQFNAPAQIGNNNTQNNYIDRHITDNDKLTIDKIMKEKKADSNFYAVKYFRIFTSFQGTNAGSMIPEIADYLKSKGLIQIRGGWVSNNDEVIKNITIDLNKVDSSFHFSFGYLTNEK